MSDALGGGGFIIGPVTVRVADDLLPGFGEGGDGEDVGGGAGGEEPEADVGAEEVAEGVEGVGGEVIVAVADLVGAVVGVDDGLECLGAETGVVIAAECAGHGGV